MFKPLKVVLCAVLAMPILAARAEMPATRPATIPAMGPVTELLAEKSLLAGYEVEIARQVNDRDEIVTTLRNGLTVIVKRVPSKVVTVRCHVRTGSVYEGKWLGGGLSHLLEHLVAGGSTQRRTEAENRNLLQKIGNNSNAYTTFDSTTFFINTTTDHMDDAVNLVTGWVFGALITPDEYRREYEVVQRELEMGKGDPDTVFTEMMYANRYRVNPSRVPVIGYQEVIQGLSRDDVYGYYQLAYQPQNMVFVVAGDIDPEKMLATVQRFVGDVKPGREFPHHIPAEPAVTGPRTMVATFPKLGHAQLSLCFPSVRLDNSDLYALDLLASILGDGYGAMLIETLRDDKQLVTEVAVADDTPDYVEGTFEVSMSLDPIKIKPATEEVLAIIDDIKKNGIDAERIKRAKVQMKVSRFRSMQTTDDISTALAEDYISTGDPHFRERYVERIEKVTNAQIKDVARRYLDRNRLITTALLPAEDAAVATLPKAEEFLRPLPQLSDRQDGKKTAVEEATRTVLSNGMVLLVKRVPSSPMVSIHMLALGGVSIEDTETNGLGNLSMSMIQRGTGDESATDVAEIFDSIGGTLATECARNDWGWSANCLGEDFEKAFTTWSAMVTTPSFDKQEFGPMKERIAGDIKGEDANWEDQAFHFFHTKFFETLKSPYRFTPEGTTDNLNKFTLEQAKKYYYEKILKAPRVLSVYGDVDPEKVRELATKLLGGGDKVGDLPKLVPPLAPPRPTNLKPQANVIRVEVQKTDQALAGVVLGYQSSSVIGDTEKPELTVATAMCSGYGYPTGYLFETLRGLGLVYTTYAQDLPGRNKDLPGGFIAVAGCDPTNVNRVVDLMLLNIARLQGTPAELQEDWFLRSKQMIVIGDAMDTETAESQAIAAAEDELLGLGYNDHDSFADKINAVTISQIGQVSRSRLRDCVVTISTPRPDLIKIPTGVREYDSFPAVDLTPKGVKHDTKSAQPAPQSTPEGATP
ncbi:pitrilysin family protein [soil metagenome]